MGEEKVRPHVLSSDGVLGPDRRPAAIKWLDEKSREAKRRAEAAQVEQRQTNRTTEMAAIVAAVASVLGIVIAILAWLFPR